MKRAHIRSMSKTPSVAQSNFQIKLESTTEIIDRLLLVDRQAPWKAIGSGGGTDDGTGTIPDDVGEIPLPV